MTYDEYMKIKGLKRVSIGLTKQQAEFAIGEYFKRQIPTKVSIQRSGKTAGLYVLQADIDPTNNWYAGALIFMRWVQFQFPEAMVDVSPLTPEGGSRPGNDN